MAVGSGNAPCSGEGAYPRRTHAGVRVRAAALESGKAGAAFDSDTSPLCGSSAAGGRDAERTGPVEHQIPT